jgi:hypothetical protein
MTATALKCPHCEATTGKTGQPFKNLSGLNTHINLHCEKKPAKVFSCTHTRYKLLNGNDSRMAQAIAAGHTKYCEKCGDLQ